MKKKFLFFASVISLIVVLAVTVCATPSKYFSGKSTIVSSDKFFYYMPSGYFFTNSVEYPLNYASPQYRVRDFSHIVFDSGTDYTVDLTFTSGSYSDTFQILLLRDWSSTLLIMSEKTGYIYLMKDERTSDYVVLDIGALFDIVQAFAKTSGMTYEFSSENMPNVFSIAYSSSDIQNSQVGFVYLVASSLGSSSGGADCDKKHYVDSNGDGYDDTSYSVGASVGYDNGYEYGHDIGYDLGYEAGKLFAGSDNDGDGFIDDSYNAGYEAGIKSDESYNVGFEAGKEWQHNYDISSGAVSDFVTDVGGSIISAFLYTGSNIEILGISLLSILGIIVLGIFAFWVFRKVRGS